MQFVSLTGAVFMMHHSFIGCWRCYLPNEMQISIFYSFLNL